MATLHISLGFFLKMIRIILTDLFRKKGKIVYIIDSWRHEFTFWLLLCFSSSWFNLPKPENGALLRSALNGVNHSETDSQWHFKLFYKVLVWNTLLELCRLLIRIAKQLKNVN